jgi:hypothetical protein
MAISPTFPRPKARATLLRWQQSLRRAYGQGSAARRTQRRRLLAVRVDRRRALHVTQQLGYRLQAGMTVGRTWPGSCRSVGSFLAPVSSFTCRRSASKAIRHSNDAEVALLRTMVDQKAVQWSGWSGAPSPVRAHPAWLPADIFYWPSPIASLRADRDRWRECHQGTLRLLPKPVPEDALDVHWVKRAWKWSRGR